MEFSPSQVVILISNVLAVLVLDLPAELSRSFNVFDDLELPVPALTDQLRDKLEKSLELIFNLLLLVLKFETREELCDEVLQFITNLIEGYNWVGVFFRVRDLV